MLDLMFLALIAVIYAVTHGMVIAFARLGKIE